MQATWWGVVSLKSECPMVTAIPYTGVPRVLAVALLAPAIVAVSAAILLSLLAVFVLWLGIVATILGAILATDLVRGSIRLLAPPPAGRLERVGVAGSSDP